jgi:hypothetical protein
VWNGPHKTNLILPPEHFRELADQFIMWNNAEIALQCDHLIGQIQMQYNFGRVSPI